MDKFKEIIVYHVDKIVKRDKLVKHRDVLYLFGDNLIRRGLGGQAKEMRGEPNSMGIITKRYPDRHSTSYIRDTDIDVNQLRILITKDIDNVLEELKTGKYRAIVIPPIGVGLANLPMNAPILYRYLQGQLGRITYFCENIYGMEFKK